MTRIANATTEPDEHEEIEVTPEMIDAGVKEFNLIDFESANAGSPDWVIDIYRAMEAVRARSGSRKRAPRASR